MAPTGTRRPSGAVSPRTVAGQVHLSRLVVGILLIA